jgi:putative hydrolase of the HAD superfamily
LSARRSSSAHDARSTPVIRAVTLDCWGTLLLDSPAGDEGYRRHRLAGMEAVLTAAGAPVRARDLERAYAASGEHLARVWRSRRDVPVRRHVTALLEALDPELPARLDEATLAELVDAYGRPALRVPPAADEGARAALDELARRGMALGVVSNVMRSSGAVLRAVLDHRGLLAPFKVLTFSDECGVRKPDPEIFRLTLDRIGVAPGEAVHVGDDPVLDVEGARDVGMRVVQVAATGRATGPARPDAVISRLGDLPAALARLC